MVGARRQRRRIRPVAIDASACRFLHAPSNGRVRTARHLGGKFLGFTRSKRGSPGLNPHGNRRCYYCHGRRVRFGGISLTSDHDMVGARRQRRRIRPLLSMLPPAASCTLQVTAVLVLPVTSAVNFLVSPGPGHVRAESARKSALLLPFGGTLNQLLLKHPRAEEQPPIPKELPKSTLATLVSLISAVRAFGRSTRANTIQGSSGQGGQAGNFLPSISSHSESGLQMEIGVRRAAQVAPGISKLSRTREYSQADSSQPQPAGITRTGRVGHSAYLMATKSNC